VLRCPSSHAVCKPRTREGAGFRARSSRACGRRSASGLSEVSRGSRARIVRSAAGRTFTKFAEMPAVDGSTRMTAVE
jgi:hypothetical protein